jgi:hypothetical protein
MGLLDSLVEAAKQQYQTTKRGFGLLASNPQQFAQEATARYFPTKEEEAQFAQAQAAGGDYMQTPYYQKIMDLSQFQGSIKPTGLLNVPTQPITEQKLFEFSPSTKLNEDSKISIDKNNKPLTEKQFYNKYAQHIDIKARQEGNPLQNIEKIMESGFGKSFNVNAVHPYRGGNPSDITSKLFGPKVGDAVYLAPKEAWESTKNGIKIKEGWKPKPWEVVIPDKDYPEMYKLYLNSFNEFHSNK